jgi:hypothetical protein
LGTDFPVEEVNLTFITAVARKDTKEYQRWFSNGKCAFKAETLGGMTLWAYSNFEEKVWK